MIMPLNELFLAAAAIVPLWVFAGRLLGYTLARIEENEEK